MAEFKLSEEQVGEIESEINALTLGKVVGRRFKCETRGCIPNYEVVCDHVLRKYGVGTADISFDEKGKVSVTPRLADTVLLRDSFPKAKAGRVDENLPFTVDNIKSFELVLGEPIHYIPLKF